MYRKDFKINLNSNQYLISLYLVSGNDPYCMWDHLQSADRYRKIFALKIKKNILF